MACPVEIEAITKKGIDCFERGQIDEAIRWYDEALNKEPNCFHTLTHKGYALLKIGNYDDALTCFKSALKANASYEPALEGLKQVKMLIVT